MSVIRTKPFKKQLTALKKSGKSAIYKQAVKILGELELGLDACRSFQSDDRIPECYKFELPDGYQIVFQKSGEDFLALIVGIYDETENFLDNNRGHVFDPTTFGAKDKPSDATSSSAPKRRQRKKKEKDLTDLIDSTPDSQLQQELPDRESLGTNEPAQPGYSAISPHIEADFVLGNFLDAVISKIPRQPAAGPVVIEPQPPVTPQDSDIADFDFEDISDSAIALFLKRHLPALRAEVDARQEDSSSGETKEPADIPAVDAQPFPETTTPPPVHLKLDEPPLRASESESSLEILYELNKLNSGDEALPIEPLLKPISHPAVPRIKEESVTEEPAPEEIESAEMRDLFKEEIAHETAETIEQILQTNTPEETTDIPAVDKEDSVVEETAAADASFETIFGLSSVKEETTTIFELPTLPEAFTTIPSAPQPIEPRPAPGPIPINEKAKLFSHAILLYRDKHYDDAILELKQLLKIDPGYAIAYKILGNAYFKDRKYSEALIAYEQYKKREPTDALLRENLAIIYSRLGLLQLALREWQALLDLQPERQDLQRRIARARQSLDEQTKPRPQVNGKLSLLNQGILHYKNKNYDQAIKIFHEALARYSESIDVYNFLGNAYFRNQMLGEAAQAYEKVKQMDSSCVAAYENMAVIFSRQGAHDRALQEWEKVLELNPQRQDVQEKIKKTIRKLREAASLPPSV